MTLQDFVAIWQAQPFRAFRLHTARGVFPVAYPLQTTFSQQMRILVVVDDVRTESFSPDEILRCEIVGPPVDLASAIGSVPPATLARHAQMLATAMTSSGPGTENETPPTPSFDAGTVTFLAAHAMDGIFLVHAAVSSQDGASLFNTLGSRWNVHGLEQFENGTSLYLHHLDHPTVEQRIIIWPPATGTFESFSEAKPLPALLTELRARDQKLAAKPAEKVEPTEAYLHGIVPTFKPAPRNLEAEAFGEAPEDLSLGYGVELLAHTTREGKTVKTLRLTDIFREEVIFDLSETDWDCSVQKEKYADDAGEISLTLRHRAERNRAIALHLDPVARTARIEDDVTAFPLAFIERHLRNFALYEPWAIMLEALRAGPRALKQPDVVLPVHGGFRMELWAGEPRFAPPFLQPRILSPSGRTLLDLRATMWAASVRLLENRSVIALRFVSASADEHRDSAAELEVFIDLLSHRVRCRGLTGSTTLGMLQSLVRHVRGGKWMLEELPTWFAKGAALPLPSGLPHGDC